MSTSQFYIHIGPMRKESEKLLNNKVSGLIIASSIEKKIINAQSNELLFVDAIIDHKPRETTLYHYDLSEFDSLAPATGLLTLYPGLDEVSVQQSVKTYTLATLMGEHGLQNSDLNILVLEQPEQALLLLKAWQAEGILDSLERLFVRTSPLSLYQGMPTKEELTSWCQQHGFETSSEKIDPASSEDPEFILLEFKRNVLHVPLKAAQEKAGTLKQECDSLQKKITEYEKLLNENAQQLSQKESTITQLREELVYQQQNQEVIQRRFEALEKKLEGKLETLLDEQRSYIQQTSNALGQHVTRVAHKQRDERALAHYLQHGQRLVSTELDPGYALALLEQYHAQDYDVVVVFGSAATTELLAKADITFHGNQSQLMIVERHLDADGAVTPSENDLPASIISIEHQKAACASIIKSLEASNCRQVVSTVYAPWVECKYRDKTTLFYSSEATLNRLGQWLPDEAKVLVIIGPSLLKVNDGSHAALSELLQYLPKQALDIVMEGLSGTLENEFKTDWNSILDSRQRQAKWYYLSSILGVKVFG